MTPTAELERSYTALRDDVLKVLAGRLRGRSMAFDPGDLEDFYNEAWHALYLGLRQGETITNPGGFLVQVAWFRAVDEYRRRHADRHDDGADLEAVGVQDAVDDRLDADQVLRAFVQGVKGELDEREATAAALCYLHGMTRPEAAEALGLTPSRMQKLMDGVSRKLAPVMEALREGRWCETRESLVRAYALGVLDPDGERHKLAVAHLDECAGCRHRVLALRGIAVVAPPLALPWAALQFTASGAAMPADAATGTTAPAPPEPATTTAAATPAAASTPAATIPAAAPAAAAGAAPAAGATAAAGAASGILAGATPVLLGIARALGRLAKGGGLPAAGGAAAAAAVVVTIVALAFGGSGDAPRPAVADAATPVATATVAATTTPAPAATPSAADRAAKREAAAERKAAAKAKAKRKAAATARAKRRAAAAAKRKAAAAATPAPTPVPTATATSTPEPAVTAAPTTAAAPAPAAPTAAPTRAPAPTGDGGQEFGFEP